VGRAGNNGYLALPLDRRNRLERPEASAREEDRVGGGRLPKHPDGKPLQILRTDVAGLSDPLDAHPFDDEHLEAGLGQERPQPAIDFVVVRGGNGKPAAADGAETLDDRAAHGAGREPGGLADRVGELLVEGRPAVEAE
jgi:hypothetical protein